MTITPEQQQGMCVDCGDEMTYYPNSICARCGSPIANQLTLWLKDRDKAAKCNNRAFRESMMCHLEMENHPLLEEARQIWEEFQDDYLFRITLLHRHGAVSAEDYYQDILTLYGRIQTGQKTVDIGLFEQCEGE